MFTREYFLVRFIGWGHLLIASLVTLYVLIFGRGFLGEFVVIVYFPLALIYFFIGYKLSALKKISRIIPTILSSFWVILFGLSFLDIPRSPWEFNLSNCFFILWTLFNFFVIYVLYLSSDKQFFQG